MHGIRLDHDNPLVPGRKPDFLDDRHPGQGTSPIWDRELERSTFIQAGREIVWSPDSHFLAATNSYAGLAWFFDMDKWQLREISLGLAGRIVAWRRLDLTNLP